MSEHVVNRKCPFCKKLVLIEDGVNQCDCEENNKEEKLTYFKSIVAKFKGEKND